MSKKAQDCYESERERGIAQDLADERSRNATLSSQVKQLEQVCMLTDNARTCI